MNNHTYPQKSYTIAAQSTYSITNLQTKFINNLHPAFILKKNNKRQKQDKRNS